MALNRDIAQRLLNKLDDLQKQIEAIHNELLVELDKDEDDLELSPEEIKEIEQIKEENVYRTLDEWETIERFE